MTLVTKNPQVSEHHSMLYKRFYYSLDKVCFIDHIVLVYTYFYILKV